MLRAARNMPASTSSFTALAFAPGALNTGMPFLDSTSTGMLLVPAPARPTARSDSGSCSLCMSAERTRIASGLLISDATSNRSRGRRSRPLIEMLLRVWILNRITRLLGIGRSCPRRLRHRRYCRWSEIMVPGGESGERTPHFSHPAPYLSSVLGLKFLHEFDQRIDALGG